MVAAFSAAAILRWHAWSYGVDLGTFAQVIDNTFHGFTDRPEAGTHFRYHWSPILALLWPVVAATRSPLSLQFVQIVLIALTAVPLAAIVRSHADEGWAFRAGLLALLYPPLIAPAFLEFHELAFYPVLALALIWAADRARWGWFAVFSIAALAVREDATLDLAIVGLVLGIIGLVRRSTSAQSGLLAGEPREPGRLAIAGFALAVLSFVTLAVYFSLVKDLGGWRPSHFYDYSFAQGPVQVALSLFTHPIELVRAIFTFGRFTYLLEAFLPLALFVEEEKLAPFVRQRVALDLDPRNVLGLTRLALERHVGFIRRAVVLAVVAAHARANQIFPCRRAAAASRHDVIDRHQLLAADTAVLTAVVVANQHVLLRQRDLLHRAADVVEHADDRGHPHLVGARSDHAIAIVNDLGFTGKEQLDGALETRNVQRFIREVQDEHVAHDGCPLSAASGKGVRYARKRGTTCLASGRT
jgi:hypothetical protein